MPVPNDTGHVERLRQIAGEDSGLAVQIMPPPSYLKALLYDGNNVPDDGVTTDIILVHKPKIKSSTSSLPIDVREEINVSMDSSVDLGGDPLPAPFADDDFDVSVSERKQYQWPKGELNHHPMKMSDALDILNKEGLNPSYEAEALSVWCLLDDGVDKDSVEEIKNGSFHGDDSVDQYTVSQDKIPILNVSKKARILVGGQVKESRWTRMYVEAQGLCSMASPEMDPLVMKKAHLAKALMPEHKMNVAVLCRYNIAGQHLTQGVGLSANASCVSLELKWRQPSIAAPLLDSSAQLIVQASVGHPSSPVHDLWKQLRVLNSLFEVLFTCWREKTVPTALPHLDPEPDDSMHGEIPKPSLESRLQTLILGGKLALQAESASKRMSLAPALLGRESMAPGRISMAPGRFSMAPSAHGRFSMAPGARGRMSMAPGFQDHMSQDVVETGDGKENKKISLIETVELAATGNRENSDFTDELFNLLIECKTYRELVSAWDSIFMELNKAQSPYIRPKNSTRAAKLIQGFVSGQCAPDFIEIEGSLFTLELLIELGLEKLSTDYYFIYLKPLLVGRDELQAPQLLRAGLGVSREKWLASCGQLLGWLAQVHSALEIVLPLENSLPETSVASTASKALKHFQSETSPVRSVECLLIPGNSLQELSTTVSQEAVHQYITQDFDSWKMTMTSEDGSRKVTSVFLRHLCPIFPPQLYEETVVSSEENVRYYCSNAVMLTQKF